MRAVVQRVLQASVQIEESTVAIQNGLLIFLGIEPNDDASDVDWLVKKCLNMRIFDDANGVMNLSVNDVSGSVLIISQFTLFASTKKGNRPSYIRAARPEVAIPLYETFIFQVTEQLYSSDVKTGIFGAHMKVTSVNDGPVTILIDTKNKE